MSYAKKDEDADMPSLKLDRTAVFQDGQEFPSLLPEFSTDLSQLAYSTLRQYHPESVEHSLPRLLF